MKTREEILRQRIEQIRRERAWLKFQRFCVELLPHLGYRRVRHGPPEGDGGADGVATRPDLQPCFASVSFPWRPGKLIEDVSQWRKEHKGEPADVVVFMVWHNPRQKTISNLDQQVQRRFGLKLEVINESTILATATRDEVWGWTCDCLGIPREGWLDPQRASELRQKYCDWLIRNYGNIDFAGYLPGRVPSGEPLFLPLQDVFVSLRVRETFERRRPELDVAKEKRGGEAEHGLSAGAGDSEPGPEELYEREGRREEVRVVKVGEALAKDAKAVILGDPGAGKTTLLKYIAVAYAGGPEALRERLALSDARTPILVSIAVFSERYAKGQIGLLPFIEELVQNANLDRRTAEVLRGDVESGRAAILLDGLDEVLTTTVRVQMVRQIGALVAAHPGNRYIVSSRIVGYGAAPVGPDFKELTVEPFDDAAIETFTRKWCVALAKFLRGDGAESVRKGEEEGATLHRAITSKPGVKSLARNPLMVTILALIHRQGRRMPSRRVELYALCTRTLIESWSQTRDLSGIPAGQELDERDILDVLCPVAYRMHCDYPRGVIPGKELRQLMVETIVRTKRRKEKDAAKEADSLLKVMKEESGLIAERGQDAYGFLHLTFEEYLTARYIAMDRARIWERLHGVLHHPRWREVVLLTAGCLGIIMEDRQRCEDWVKEIRKAGSPLEDSIHRDLLLALECVCDDLRISLETEVAIVEEALELFAITESRDFGARLCGLLARVPLGALREQVGDFLLARLTDEDGSVRQSAAAALGTLGQASEAVIQSLLAALKDESWSVRARAASALGKVGPSEEGITTRLAERFLEDSDYDVADAAYRALLKIAGKLDREKFGEPVPCE